MSDSDNKVQPKFITRLINGAIGGVIGSSVIFPLDFGKTRIQNQTGLAPTNQETKINGPRSVYKGLGVNLVFVMPEKAIKLSVNDQMRSFLGGKKGEFMSLHREILAGSSAGLCQVIITTPMELLKIQMQLSSANSNQANVKARATSIAFNMIKNNGIFGLYKGVGPTILRDVFFSAIYFPFFAYLNSKGKKENFKNISFQHTLVSGLIAGSLAAFLATPFDVIKTRIQSPANKSQGIHYDGIIDCFLKTAKTDKLRAFFRGSVARMTVIAPLFGIAQTIYFLGIAEKLLGYSK